MTGALKAKRSKRGDMLCACGGKTGVIDTRAFSVYIRRRRKCLVCGERFSTYEYRAVSVEAIFEPLVTALETANTEIRLFRGKPKKGE